MECYNGTQGSEQLIQCPMGMDRCVYAYPIPDTGLAGSLCAFSTNLTDLNFTDNACSTVSEITACLCDTDGCNTDFNNSKCSGSYTWFFKYLSKRPLPTLYISCMICFQNFRIGPMWVEPIV